MSLRGSQVKVQRRARRKLVERRLEEGICVVCRGILDHHQRYCDYCYLANRIGILRRELTRVERLFIK